MNEKSLSVKVKVILMREMHTTLHPSAFTCEEQPRSLTPDMARRHFV
jgi:hypothetical protein